MADTIQYYDPNLRVDQERDRALAREAELATDIAGKAPNTDATPSVAGKMSAADKGKLDGIATGATANDTDANLKNRAHHTGSQAISTVTGLQDALDGKAPNTDASPSVAGKMSAADKAKLDAIEAGATADMSAVEIKTAYEGNSNTNAYTDVEKTKLAGVAAGAQVNPSASAIKTAYESNADTNAFSDAEQSKLSGVATGATANAADSALRDRSTHTGSQAISTVTGLDDALDGKAALATPIQTQGRPGDALDRFTASLGGEGSDGAPAPGVPAINDDLGAVRRITGAATIALRERIAVNPGDAIEVLYRFQRATNPTDPSGATVRLAVHNLNKNKASVSHRLVEDITLFVEDDPRVVRAVFSSAEGEGIDFVWPATTRYIDPYIQTFDLDGVTDIAVIEWRDITATLANELALAGKVDQADYDAKIPILEAADEANATAIEDEIEAREGMIRKSESPRYRINFGTNPATGFSFGGIDLLTGTVNFKRFAGKADRAGQADSTKTIVGWDGLVGYQRAPSDVGKFRQINRAGFVVADTSKASSTPTNPTDPTVPPNDIAPLHGPEMFVVAGRTFEIYPPQMQTDRRWDRAIQCSVGSGAFGASDADCITVDPDRLGTEGEIRTTRLIAPETNLVIKRRGLTIRKAVTGAGSANVLMIGDSITDHGLIEWVRQRLVAMGRTPTFVGTVVSALEYTTGNGPLGEGRSSRSFADYLHIATGEMAPVAVGGEAAYLAGSKGAKVAANPFIREAVVGDPADDIFNGYVFDFASYLSRFSIAAPAVVHLGLGTNDISTGTPGVDVITTGLRIITASIRAALPSAKIYVWLPGIPRISNGNRWTIHQQAIRAMLDWAKNDADANMHLVSAWAHMHPELGWQYTGATTDPLTGIETLTISDVLHPLYTPRDQLAEVLACAAATAF